MDDADSATDSGAAGLQKKLESARVATAVRGGSQAAEASGLLSEADTHENELLSDGGGGVERGQEQRSSFQAALREKSGRPSSWLFLGLKWAVFSRFCAPGRRKTCLLGGVP